MQDKSRNMFPKHMFWKQDALSIAKSMLSYLMEASVMATRKRYGNPKVGIGYCRVSTDRTRQELGAESQVASIKEYASRHGIQLMAVYVEEASGGLTLERRKVLMEAWLPLQPMARDVFW